MIDSAAILFRSNKQLAHREPERCRHAHEDGKGRVGARGLDAPDLSRLHADPLGRDLLRPASGRSKLSNALRERCGNPAKPWRRAMLRRLRSPTLARRWHGRRLRSAGAVDEIIYDPLDAPAARQRSGA